jgi:hypothetical protein
VKVTPHSHQPLSSHPTHSFSHQTSITARINSFRFSTLRTLSPDGISLLFSFQQITHSFPSHGTGHPVRSSFHLQCFRFFGSLTVGCKLSTVNSHSAKSFIYRTCKKSVRKSFGCRTYRNKGLITLLFAAHKKNTGVSPCPAFHPLWATIFPSQKSRPS